MLSKSQFFKFVIALLIPLGAYAQDNDIGGTAANPDDNQRLQDVYWTDTEIVIDGDLSEWNMGSNSAVDPLIGIPKIGRDGRVAGDPPTSYVIHEELGGTWTGPEDQSSTMKFLWNDGGDDDPNTGGIYIGIVVTDDYHENAANSGWNGDSAQMMFTEYDADAEEHGEFALYNFALGGTDDQNPEELTLVSMFEKRFADFFDPPVLVDPENGVDEGNVEIAITRDFENQKTYYEMRFGSEVLALADGLAEGVQFGFGIAINDGDEDATGQKGWVGLGAHSIVFGKTASEAAVMTLAGVEPGGCNPDTKGDIDGNGVVEFADFLTLSGNFGNAVPAGTDGHTIGDLDCNGTVEFADFLVLSGNFGQNVGGAAAVPEPSAFGLAGISLVVLGFLRRRRIG